MTQQTINMKRKSGGGNRKSKEEGVRMMTDILALSDKQDDLEIMITLNLPKSTFYRYKRRIFKESKKMWEQTCKESLEYRALQLKKTLEFCLKVNQDIASDSNQDAKDRIDALNEMLNAQVNYLRFLRDASEFITNPSTN